MEAEGRGHIIKLTQRLMEIVITSNCFECGPSYSVHRWFLASENGNSDHHLPISKCTSAYVYRSTLRPYGGYLYLHIDTQPNISKPNVL